MAFHLRRAAPDLNLLAYGTAAERPLDEQMATFVETQRVEIY
jgi:hypothetical protein